MKKILKNLILLVVIAIGSTSCSPEEVVPVGNPDAIIPQLQGNWKVSKVNQIDRYALDKGFPYKTLDITNLYPYTSIEATFNVDSQGKPTTFSINTGSAPINIKVKSGNWSTDNDKAPKLIYLVNGSDSSIVELGNYSSLASNQMILRLTRYQMTSKGPVAALSYDYVMDKK